MRPGAGGAAVWHDVPMTPRDLAASLETVLRTDLPLLRALPDGPDSTRPNRPSGAGWSRREELGHLVDSAVNNHHRIAHAALAPKYEGPGYDQHEWVALHHWQDTPWPSLVDAWHAHNAVLVPLVAALPEAGLSTPCRVAGGPPVPLGALIEDYVLHMRHHLDQVLRRPVVTRYPRA